jgi:hypothetical protein
MGHRDRVRPDPRATNRRLDAGACAPSLLGTAGAGAFAMRASKAVRHLLNAPDSAKGETAYGC